MRWGAEMYFVLQMCKLRLPVEGKLVCCAWVANAIDPYVRGLRSGTRV
jgi:hypothetical protein